MKISKSKFYHSSWNDITLEKKGQFCDIYSEICCEFIYFSREGLLNIFDANKNEKVLILK